MDDKVRVLVVLLLMAAGESSYAQAVDAAVKCMYSGTAFVYDCTLTLRRGTMPVSDAVVTVGADMPSMPMAHNVKPVRATPGEGPGQYWARLALEMAGEWMLKVKVTVSGLAQQPILVRQYFGEDSGPGKAPHKH
jgi:hypothetical protein